MNFNISDLQFYQLLYYVVFGVFLAIAFYVVNGYIIPLLKHKQQQVLKYWQKIQIISWVLFYGLFFIALIKVNLLITLTFTIIALGIGWNFWRNIFSGIIIKFNNQYQLGEMISTDFVKGEIISINLSQSELMNEKGEIVIVPNSKLREAVLTHYYKKSNVQTHSFKVVTSSRTTETIYQLALNCPYISANQKIEILRGNGNEFTVNASIIDLSFSEKVEMYFSNLK